MTRVLVVEDEPALADALATALRTHRYEVVVAHTGGAALDASASWRPDLVVLDLGLPDLTGVEVLRAVRGWSAVPVVALSAGPTTDDKAEALDAGADDHLSRPFTMDELLARLRTVVHHPPAGDSPPVVQTATFTVDLVSRRVLRDGAEVPLTPTEWDLLELLARNVGTVVGRRELLTELDGTGAVTAAHDLRTHLAQLRRKLEPDRLHPRHLVTVPGLGYRLVP